MLVTTHLFIPGPTNVPEAVRSAMDILMEDMRSGESPKFTSATSRPEAKLRLAR